MNSYAALEHNRAVKIVPLTLKDLGIRGISKSDAERGYEYRVERGQGNHAGNHGSLY